MKSLNVISAILAGLIGTVAMTALMYAAPLMGLPPMDLLQALGSLIPLGISPYVAGALMHLANGLVLALLYAGFFERVLPGPRWARGAAFSLLPWLFAITLLGPAMVWFQDTVTHAEAQAVTMNPCAVAAPTIVNPCAAAPESSQASNPWVVRMMSLAAHLVYGATVAAVYRRRDER